MDLYAPQNLRCSYAPYLFNRCLQAFHRSVLLILYECVNKYRRSLERIAEHNEPIRRLVAVFGLYTFYFTQPSGSRMPLYSLRHIDIALGGCCRGLVGHDDLRILLDRSVRITPGDAQDSLANIGTLCFPGPIRVDKCESVLHTAGIQAGTV